MFLTSSAHSLDRNLTATLPPWSVGLAQYIRSVPAADRRSATVTTRSASESKGTGRRCTNVYQFATVALLGLFVSQLVELIGRVRPISVTARTMLAILAGLGLTW